jgi:hypothetical protein
MAALAFMGALVDGCGTAPVATPLEPPRHRHAADASAPRDTPIAMAQLGPAWV